MQAFGRTPLTNISPKKTWEGALAGLGGCIATAVLLSKLLCWPSYMLRYTVVYIVNLSKSQCSFITFQFGSRYVDVKLKIEMERP